MLTYESIRKIANEEKQSTKLVELPENFFKEVMAYIAVKSKLRTKEDTWELDSAKRLLQDILEWREKKIVNIALYNVRTGVSPGKITPEEKEFFDKIVASVKSFQDARKQILLGKKESTLTVAFLEETPEFVAINEKRYGPFKSGDIATIPEKNAKVLVDNNIARIIKI